MLNQQGFDSWAGEYDKTVREIDKKNQYPFAGYQKIVTAIYKRAVHPPQSRILDIGFGTGLLAGRLYEEGHDLTGVDFSNEMISIAKSKMPKAQLYEWDITNGLPPAVMNQSFDTIISTYALHHLTDAGKVSLIKQLLPLVKPGGQILIGDVAFQTHQELDQCRRNYIEVWDENEYYFVYEELAASLAEHCSCEFTPISHCGGVIELK
ncbi:class I SAM-dependent methyltransferase [Halobacillus sp. A5]|uniref:class I SAM-dependent methyltransferase n=1 Tax=Halobacillus sp. A5 TaxID=2880263 RepID=UPI0020A6B7EA|nr:class I SAM-dependent methyltransferase [Halobacillus sp. A5]MCP3027201.1 class I SAM-dependent methyltransferase [Halobacillus sp. A5]